MLVMSFEDWYHQHIYQVIFTNLGESSNSSQYGLGPSDELYKLAFKQNVPTEVQCIDPALLELTSEKPDGEGRPFLLDHAVECERGTGDLESIGDLVSDVAKDPESIMNIDEEPPGTEVLVLVETDEQIFDRPEVRELVNIHDIPVIPETPPPILEADAEGSGRVPHQPPLSPALSSPLSSALRSPVPLYTEAGVEVWLVERIIQAWGPHNGRQYLIRWAGWGPEFDTWEPAVNVSEELKAGFERSRLCRRLSLRRQRRQRKEWGSST